MLGQETQPLESHHELADLFAYLEVRNYGHLGFADTVTGIQLPKYTREALRYSVYREKDADWLWTAEILWRDTEQVVITTKAGNVLRLTWGQDIKYLTDNLYRADGSNIPDWQLQLPLPLD